jgi:putative oxidoreductase
MLDFSTSRAQALWGNSGISARWMPHGLAALRIVSGLLFIEHGTQKLFGFPAPAHGLSPLLSLMGIGGCLEIVGGLSLVLGFQTRLVAFILSGEMGVAYFMAHAPRSFFPVLNGGDPAILFCFIFLLFVCAGSGSLSIDTLMQKRRAARPT